MEPLIKFRLLGSQLQKDEIQHFLQEIVRVYGFDKILSCIFNYFLNEYNQTKHHNNDLSNITNIISTIIHSRARESIQSSKKDINEILPMTINRLSSDLIGECGSYLRLNDYINFMNTNRTIYCASNSPMTLQKLDIIKYKNQPLDLTRFSMVKALFICPEMYNKCQVIQFTNLTKLHIKNGTEDVIEIFTNSDRINFTEITHLKLNCFGTFSVPYDFDAFCRLLTKFPNVTHLELSYIELTEFNDINSNIENITPKLQELNCWMIGANISANSLKNKLMNLYSKQLKELDFDELDANINVYSFVNLEEIHVYCAKNDSLKQIINSATNLKVLSLQRCECNETTKDIILKSFQKFTNMEAVKFICGSSDIQNVTSYIEMGLVNSKETTRKSLKVFVSLTDGNNIKMRDVELYVIRIMNALKLSTTNDIMLIFNIPILLDTNDYMKKIVAHFKSTHLVTVAKDGKTIMIANKNCKINGYYFRSPFMSF